MNDIMHRLVEQVDQLSEGQVKRNAIIKQLREALQRCCDEQDYCYVCDNHPSHGHAPDCPVP
jgi:hypothetical protein